MPNALENKSSLSHFQSNLTPIIIYTANIELTMRIFVILFTLFTLTTTARCQEVYNLVLENATKVVNSPTSGFAQTQIAQFKRTALIYMKSKAFERTDSVPAVFLNTQAYYMSEFLSLFFNVILKDKKSDASVRKEKILIFMNASAMNPLYNDEDKETTMAFVNDGGELTPFSLDTDWQKAYLAAKENLGKGKEEEK